MLYCAFLVSAKREDPCREGVLHRFGADGSEFWSSTSRLMRRDGKTKSIDGNGGKRLRACLPDHRDLPVAAVDTAHVLQILEPIWLEKNETASRLRGRIEKILDWARVRGFREGENPARWKGHLDHLLPKVQKKEH